MGKKLKQKQNISKKLMSLSKCCKNCNKEFVLLRKGTARGSANLFNRVFCNNKCKNEFNRRKIDGKIQKNCTICDKIFYCFPSQLKNLKCCSQQCSKISKIKNNFIQKICAQCQKKFFLKYSKHNVKQKFCSKKCHNDSCRIVKTCITCKKEFIDEMSNKRKRCSQKCQYFDQSNGTIKINMNGRTGYRKDIGFEYYFKSALEADFARMLIYCNIKFDYEKTTFYLVNKHYTPDFYLPEYQMFIELKGIDLKNKKNLDFFYKMTKNIKIHKYLKQKNIKIITVTQNEFITTLKSVNIWKEIPILELRNYRKNKDLVITYENKKNIH